MPEDDEYLTAPTRKLTIKGGRVVGKEDAATSAVQLPSARQCSAQRDKITDEEIADLERKLSEWVNQALLADESSYY